MIAVIQGGHESEAEISRMTSKAFQESLKRQGFEYKVLEYGPELKDDLLKLQPNKCLNAMHGKYGEDGLVQELLESLGLPYTGSGVESSRLAFNKHKALLKAQAVGVPILPSFICKENEVLPEVTLSKVSEWKDGFVVKPVESGSSRGVSLCSKMSELDEALKESYQWDNVALVEKRLVGRELTVAVFEGRAFEAIEISPKTGFYDMANKYTKGATEYLIPAPVAVKTQSKLQEYALQIFKTFNLKTYARVDFLMSGGEQEIYFMEVNSLPGCTPTSLLPKSLAAAGLSFDYLIKRLLETA